ncbi:MAG: transmembrane proteins 14C-domain-containing protein [Benjaminiella poitrasii]|nr:MAG: transmembrane proteins 14C-domain-containing protein [Benjaminiella poitrasii]
MCILFYLLAGSIMSLLAGTVFGALSGLGAYQVSANPRKVVLAFMVSFVLFFVMGSRFYRGRKFMPAGLVTLLSLLMMIRYGACLF